MAFAVAFRRMRKSQNSLLLLSTDYNAMAYFQIVRMTVLRVPLVWVVLLCPQCVMANSIAKISVTNSDVVRGIRS